MLFSSAVFIFLFLPAFLAAYFLMPSRAARNVVLLLFSLVFYAWGEPVYVVLMVCSIFFNWALALGMEHFRSHAKALLIIDIALNLTLLGFFKYEGFFADNINALLGTALVPNLELPLPIGISFYTLQALSYVIDVYRREVPPQRNLLYLGMYISMFPQLIAGPIVRYQTIQDQVVNRHENLRDFQAGARLFSMGMAKKVLLANTVAVLATKMMSLDGSQIGMVGAWGGLLAYTFQIFFDFSGYSDMAIGLGKMCGFQYLRNFNYPYISKSVTEFWRRWHVSLSSFFRDYVYIPLGGSRVARPRWIFNLVVVWFLTGFWHGAAWNFILWGLLNLAFLLLEKLLIGKALAKAPAALQHMYAWLAFMLCWLVFWLEDVPSIASHLMAMLGVYGITGASTAWEITVWEYVPVFAVCLLASTPVIPWLRAHLVAWAFSAPMTNFMDTDLPHVKRLSTQGLCDYDYYFEQAGAAGSPSASRLAVCKAIMALSDVALLGLLVLSCASIISGSFNPFIYFRF